MNKLNTAGAAVLIAGMSISAGAQAAYVASLQYIQPTGTVLATDTIDVRVRLTLDPSSDPLTVVNDPVGPPPFGVPVANYPSPGTVDFNYYDGTTSTFHTGGTILSIDNIFLNTFFECSGNFAASCISGPPYSFNFNTTGPETINFIPNGDVSSISVAPGGSYDYLFGSFTPDGGAAPVGTYTFYNTGVTLNFTGTIQNDEGIFTTGGGADATATINLALTPCQGITTPGCGEFTRTVVPVPAAGWLIFSALGGLGFAARRR
jgi:hypothetical protein